MTSADIKNKLQEIGGVLTQLILRVSDIEQKTNHQEKQIEKDNFKTDLENVVQAIRKVQGQVDNIT